MNYFERIAAVLAEINRIRSFRGLAPLGVVPRGTRRDTKRCTLACALGPNVEVGVDVWFEPATHTTHPLPQTLVDFRRDFDAGLFPELIA